MGLFQNYFALQSINLHCWLLISILSTSSTAIIVPPSNADELPLLLKSSSYLDLEINILLKYDHLSPSSSVPPNLPPSPTRPFIPNFNPSHQHHNEQHSPDPATDNLPRPGHHDRAARRKPWSQALLRGFPRCRIRRYDERRWTDCSVGKRGSVC